MSDGGDPTIKELLSRIEGLEKELADKRATDAYLFLMIQNASSALLAMIEWITLTLKKEPTEPAQQKADDYGQKFEECSTEADRLIWGGERVKDA